MDKKFMGLMGVFFLTFAMFASMVIFRNTYNIRAKEELKVSAANSLLFAFPLEIPTIGGKATISIFARDPSTKPVPNKNVTINFTKGLVNPSAVTTDEDGKATAFFTCTTSGIAEVSAIIEDTPVTQQVTIKCN
jgi:hypothetical protein